MKRIHPALLSNIHATETPSLLDWVSLEEVSQMQREAYNEMAEMLKLSVFLRKTNEQLKRKFAYINQMFEHITPSYNEFVNYNKNIKSKATLASRAHERISGITLDLTIHTDRVQHFLDMYQAGSFKAEDYESLVSFSKGLKSQIIEVREHYTILEELKKEIEGVTGSAKTGILQAKQLVFLIDFFGHECNKKSKSLIQVHGMWREHCQGYEGLFVQINTLTNSYNKCLVSYDEMLKEITRRREFLERQQRRVDEIQKEFDTMYEEEMKAREAYKSSWGVNLPALCPALEEVLEKKRVFPPHVTTNLPIISPNNSTISSNIHLSPILRSREGENGNKSEEEDQSNGDKKREDIFAD
eukprot:TRINITY_DN2848_c0_g1_i2.p1 TRINITY_DN2848_c0_g1~~TRINITY_DN2848_c0_g1_i2.p1  ORF type:complete len:356 (-),score=70.81 TRINITY_DN2848_c0_g1_i2:128-1195(-)